MKMISILVDHPKNYEYLSYEQKKKMCKCNVHPESFDIKTIIQISKSDFVELKSNLTAEHDYLKYNEGVFLVKEKGANDYEGLLIDTVGGSSPVYVGIPMKEVEFKKCPRCFHIYTEPPAISRKDNKTEICSQCGMEEALEAIGIDLETSKLINDLHYKANDHNIKIIVKIPNKEDIVIEPDK